MQRWSRFVVVLLLWVLVVTACTAGQAQAPSSSSAVAPTAPAGADLVFAPGSLVAEVDVGGLTFAAATEKVRINLAALALPLELRAGTETLTLRPSEFALQLPIDALMTEARSRAEQGEAVRVLLQAPYDAALVRSQVATFAERIATPPASSIITSTKGISRSFAYRPGRALDLEAVLRQIDERLRTPQASRQIDVTLSESTAPVPDFAAVQAQVEAMAEEWDGVVGFYLLDLKSGTTVTLNEDTVFSGASVMKVPIMLQSYVALETFDDEQQQWLKQMIIDSDNLAANNLLAASIGGRGTDDALEGVLAMSEMLGELGLEHTYQYMPYEAGDYLIGVRKIKIKQGPPREGSPPYTDADPVIRTTPAEMGRVFTLIYECSTGKGELLTLFGKALTAQRCKEMIDYLEQNADTTRMVAGLPEDAQVAHKSGWIDDMQADVGIVRSPGGDFVLAVYLYRPQNNSYLTDGEAGPWLASFARMAYTAYNPLPLR